MIAQLNYVWSTEFPLNLDDLPKKFFVRHFCIFSFSQYGLRGSSCTSCSAGITARAPRPSPPLWDFSHTPPAPSRRSPVWGWGRQLLLFPLLTHHTENIIWDGDGDEEAVAIIAIITSHTLTCSLLISSSGKFGTYLANLLESFRSLWRVAWAVLINSHGPEQVSWHSPSGHSPLQQQFWWWKPLCWGASEPLPLFPLLCLLILAYIYVLFRSLSP